MIAHGLNPLQLQCEFWASQLDLVPDQLIMTGAASVDEHCGRSAIVSICAGLEGAQGPGDRVVSQGPMITPSPHSWVCHGTVAGMTTAANMTQRLSEHAIAALNGATGRVAARSACQAAKRLKQGELSQTWAAVLRGWQKSLVCIR